MSRRNRTTEKYYISETTGNICESALRRCQETAEILFPEQKVRIIDQLAECDFGAFENKNYKELSDDPRYQAWIDSNGIMAFPEGESKEECAARNLEGFQRAVTTCIREEISEAALVVHGGTILNIMENMHFRKKNFMSGMSEMDVAIWWNWSRPSGRKTGESFRCWRQESKNMTFQITEKYVILSKATEQTGVPSFLFECTIFLNTKLKLRI